MSASVLGPSWQDGEERYSWGEVPYRCLDPTQLIERSWQTSDLWEATQLVHVRVSRLVTQSPEQDFERLADAVGSCGGDSPDPLVQPGDALYVDLTAVPVELGEQAVKVTASSMEDITPFEAFYVRTSAGLLVIAIWGTADGSGIAETLVSSLD